jgi:hypothetical protein
MRLDELSRDDWIVGGLALLLAIDLLFLPWFSGTATYLTITVTFTATATSAPDGWTAIIAVLASLAIVADLLIERLSPATALPNIGASRTSTRFALAAIAAGFVALKFLLHVDFSNFGFGFYAGVVLVAALVYVTRRISQDLPALHNAS